MSCLLGRGYFEEVGGFESRVYKNNALSAILREGDTSSLRSAIGLMFEFTSQLLVYLTNTISFLLYSGDEAFRAASRLLDAAKTTAPVNPDKPHKKLPAVNIAYNFSGSIFEWMSRPEEAWRGKRLGEAMQQLHRMCNINVSEGRVDNTDWSSPLKLIGLQITRGTDCRHRLSMLEVALEH